MKKLIRSLVSLVLTAIMVLNTLPLTALADTYYGYLDGKIGVNEARGGPEDEPDEAPTETQTVVEYQVVFNDYVFDSGVMTENTVEYGRVSVREGATASIGAPEHEGYRFLGWSESLENVTRDMTVTAQYERIAAVYTLRVDYLTSSDGVLEASWEKQYLAGTQVQETIISPVLTGYTADLAQVVFSIPSIDADETRTVRYTPSQTTYTVEHYQQNAEGAGYTKVDADTAVVAGTSGETVTVNAKTYDGFTATKASTQAKVAGDGTTVIKFYYDRNYYTLTFDGQGGIPPAAISQRYGSTIDWSLLVATRGGYAFTGWAATPVGTGSMTPEATMPKENKTYYAKYTAQTVNYTVVYWLENAEDTEYSYLKTETRTATAGSTVTLTAANVNLTGYVDAAHFTFKESDTATIKGDGSSIINVRYSRKSYTFKITGGMSLTITAKYGANISSYFPLKVGNTEYELTPSDDATKALYGSFQVVSIEIMPGANCTFTSAAITGSTFSVYYYLETPGGSRTYRDKTFTLFKTIHVKTNAYLTYNEEFYPIVGFERFYAVGIEVDKNGNNITGKLTEIPGSQYWYGLRPYQSEVFLYYSRSSYNLEYNNGYTVIQTVAKAYESNFTAADLAYVPAVPSQLPSDATFDGWYYGPNGSGGLVTTAKKMPASNFVVFANWLMPNRTVTFIVDAGNDTTQTYNYGETTVAPQNPTKEGYVFKGWYYVGTDNQFVFGQPIYENATVEARWVQEENLGYVVKHIADGQTTLTTTVATGFAAGATVTETALTTADLVQEGWESGVLYVPDATTKTITIQETASENVIEFHYAVRKSYVYTVRYVDEKNAPIIPEEERTTDSQTIYERYKAIPGYTLTSDPVQYLALASDQAQNIVTFTYKSNATKYTIHYVLKDPSGSEADRITEVVEKDGSGNPLMAGALVTIAPPADKFANAELAPGNVLTKNINGNGTTEFIVIYQQHLLTVRVALTDGVMAGKIVAPAPNTTVEGHSAYQGIMVSGKTVSLNTEPILPGYHFLKWTLDYGSLVSTSAAATSFVMPYANAVVVAHYEKDDPIPLKITANSADYNYNGTARSVSGYAVEGLLGGHVLSGVSAGRTETAAGHYEVKIVGTPKVTRTSDGLDVTYMYGIQPYSGWLDIGRIPLTITPENRVETYDGTEYFIETFTSSGLVSGHVLNTTGLKSEAGLIDAGSISVGIAAADLNKIKVYSGTGENRVDVTDNYYISTGKGTLTVNPRELELTAASGNAGYDGNIHHIKDLTSTYYTVKAGCLVNGDQVDATSVSITGFGINAGSYDTNLVPADGKIKVMNGQKDVTGNYTLKLVPGTLRIGKAQLTVIPTSTEKIYNGKTQTSTAYTVEGLIGGDKVKDGTVTVSGSGMNVGKYAINVTSGKADLKILTSDGTTIAPDNYEISFGSGWLTILQRPLVIQAGEESYVFNGEEQKVQGYTPEEKSENRGLADGHSLVPGSVKQNLSGSQRDVGESVTSITTTNGIRINDAGGNNVTSNYDISTTKGLITVTKRPLYLVAGSQVYTYNGTEREIDDYTARPYDSAAQTGLVPGHVIDDTTVTLSGKLTEVGELPTSIIDTDKIVIWNGAVDEAKNYDIRTEEGLLKITQKKLIIYAGSDVVDFDGTTHTVDTFTVDSQFGLENGDALVDSTVKAKLSGSIRDAGWVTTSITSTEGITIKNGAKVVTQNYDIELKTGKLTVNPLKITVYAGTERHVYDGQEHVVSSYKPVGSFVGTHHVVAESVEMTGARTDAGEATTRITDAAVIRVEDANGNDETRNYEITKATGTLTIDKRPLVIQAGVEEYVFNGAEQKVKGFTSLTGVDSGLVQGHGVVEGTVTPLLNGSRRNVGTTDTTITTTNGITVKDGAGNTVTGNYAISVTAGSITIRPRPVTVIAGTETHDYTGLPHTVSTFDVSAPGIDTGLVTGHEVKNVELEGTLTDKGDKETKIVNTESNPIQIWSGTGEETGNYKISTQTGTLTVKAIRLILYAGTEEYGFDGSTHKVQGYKVDSVYGLVNGDEIVKDTVKLEGSRRNAGEEVTRIVTKDGIVIKNGGKVVTDNYEIELGTGLLTVTKKDLIITAESDSVEYNGYNHSITDLKSPAFSWEGTVAGDTVKLDSVTVDGAGRNAGIYTTSILNKTDIVVLQGTENATGNYNIILGTGDLEITKKKLRLIADSLDLVYDAQTHGVTTYTVDPLNNLGYGDSLDASTVEVQGSGMYVGTHDVDFVNPKGIAVKTGSQDATKNYDIETVPGTIKIAQRDLLITAGTEQHLFDGDNHTVTTYLIDGLQGTDKEDGESIRKLLVGTRREVGSVETSIPTTAGIAIKANGGTGADVTRNYNIKTEKGKLTICEQGITLTADSLKKVFTGETFVVNTYTVTGLRSDYTLENVKVNTSLRDVGKIPVTFINPDQIIIRDEKGEKVTENYAINLESGLLEVTPATVTLKVVDGSREYNGADQTLTEVIAIGLAPGDALVDGTVKTAGSRRDVGFITGNITIPSVAGVKVKDGAGKEVQSNYTFVPAAGTLTITQRDLTIRADSAVFTYNGQYQSQPTYTIVKGGVVGDDKLSGVEITGSIRDVGTDVPNKVGGTIQVTNGADDRTGNYNIVLENGTLKMKPKGITITAQSDETDFNGEIQNIVDVATGHNKETFLVTGLEAGDEIDKSTVTVTGEGRDKGNYTTAIADVEKIRIYRSGVDVTGNYSINPENGVLAIGTQTLVIQGQTKTVVYDGTLRNITDVCAGLGELPYVIASGQLAAGDKILASSLSVDGNIQYVGDVDTTVKPATGGIRIVNAQGVDVTDNYNIKPEKGKLTVIKADLVLKARAESYPYTGKEQKAREYDVVSGLGSGDAVDSTTVTLSGALTYVGTIDTSIVNKEKIKVMKGARNVTDNYNIILEKGTLTITPVPLEITADSDKKQFTGETFTVKTFTAKTLLNGDAVKADTVTISGERRNVGTTTTEIKSEDIGKIKVFNGTKDVTNCYTITVKPGVLEVTKKPITMTAQSATTAFNGQIQNIETVAAGQGKDTFLVSGLVDGAEVDKSTVKVTGEGRDNGDYDTAIVDVDKIRIYKGSDDETGNYSITTKTGTLTITGMALVIKAASATVEYNGATRTIEEACGLASIPTYDVSVGQLAAGDNILPSSLSVSGSIKNVGSVDTTIKAASGGIKIMNGGTDVTKNYAITTDTGTLTMTPRDLYIQAGVESYPYTGKEQKVQGYTPRAGDLVNGDIVQKSSVTLSGARTDVGSEGTAVVNKDGIRVLNGTTNVTKNYNIHVLPGTITITPAKVILQAGSGSAVYNGQSQLFKDVAAAQSLALYKVVQAPLNGDQVLAGTVIVDGERLNVGEAATVINAANIPSIQIYAKDGVTRRTDNYEIEVLPGKLTITPRVVTITPDDKSKTYGDGDPTWTATIDGLVSPDDVDVTMSRVAGESKGKYAISVASATLKPGDPMAPGFGQPGCNYTLKLNTGNLTIAGKELVIQAGSDTQVFSGQTYTVNNAYTVTGLEPGDDVVPSTVTVNGSRRNVGETTTSIASTTAIRIMNNGKNVTGNYIIKPVTGTLTVTPKEITIYAGTQSFTYNGAVQKVTTIKVPDGALAAGDSVDMNSVTLSGSRKDVGTEVTEILTPGGDIKIKGSTNATKNYSIQTGTGLLTITKRKLVITAGKENHEYDATEHIADGFTASGLVGGDTVDASTVQVTGSRRNVGTTPVLIVNGGGIAVKNGQTPVTDNYEIITADGALTVSPRQVTIGGDWFTKYNGDFDPVFTATVTGLVNGDKVTYKLKRDPGEENATYQVRLSDVKFTMKDPGDVSDPSSPDFNYTLKMYEGKLTVLGRVIYNANGGSGGVPTDNSGYAKGDGVSVKFSPSPSKNGMKFIGWSTSANAGVPTYYEGGTTRMYMGAQNINLYAVYANVDTSKGKVEYYFDGELNPRLTNTMHNLVVGSKVSSYPGVRVPGYREVDVENLPMVVDADESQNVIKVYYEAVENGVMIVDADIPLGAGTASLNVGECIE